MLQQGNIIFKLALHSSQVLPLG